MDRNGSHAEQFTFSIVIYFTRNIFRDLSIMRELFNLAKAVCRKIVNHKDTVGYTMLFTWAGASRCFSLM